MADEGRLPRSAADESVIATNDDATLCKCSASKLGYFKDNFVNFFCRTPERRPPIINRGYYARVSAMRLILKEFILSGGKQIIGLGGGYDTNYFNLVASGDIQLGSDFSYIEIDFPEVILTKAGVVRRRLTQSLANAVISQTGEILSSNYSTIAGDLRMLDAVQAKLAKVPNFSFDKPTLFLSECVLIYLTVPEADAVLQWCASAFSSSGVIIYEQIKPFDPFGLTMQRNLKVRGCPLLTLLQYPGLSDQEKRCLTAGFTQAEARDMNDIWQTVLNSSENSRIGGIEPFDEFEEWNLFQEHYCMVLASQGKSPAQSNVWALTNFAELARKETNRRLLDRQLDPHVVIPQPALTNQGLQYFGGPPTRFVD